MKFDGSKSDPATYHPENPNPVISRPFCAWTESKHPEVDALVDSLADEIEDVLLKGVRKANLKNHIRKIVLELLVAFDSSPDLWINYPRRRQKYGQCSMMQRMGLQHGPFLAVVDALHALGYIEHIDGNWNLGIQSCMRATSLLIEAIRIGRVEPRMVHLDHDPIYLRDNDGKYIDFKETARRKQMANRIVALNKLLRKTDITFPLKENQQREYISLARHIPEMHRCTLYRVFNRGQFRFGGRFYGHAVQSIKSSWRQFLRINGESVCELDYGGMHIRLLYAKAGAVPPLGDVYDVGVCELDVARFQHTWGVSLRSVLKLILLVGINARTEKATIEAVLAELSGEDESRGCIRLDDDQRKEFRRVLASLLKALKKRHPQIAHFLCADQGIRLQRQDSDIADMILNEFVKKGRPIVPIHDSFLVRQSDRSLLWATMGAAWRKHCPGVDPVIEDKINR